MSKAAVHTVTWTAYDLSGVALRPLGILAVQSVELAESLCSFPLQMTSQADSSGVACFEPCHPPRLLSKHEGDQKTNPPFCPNLVLKTGTFPPPPPANSLIEVFL